MSRVHSTCPDEQCGDEQLRQNQLVDRFLRINKRATSGGLISVELSISCFFFELKQNVWTGFVRTSLFNSRENKLTDYAEKSRISSQCFRAKKISAEQRWFRSVSLWNSAVQLCNSSEFFSSEQRWFIENQSWSALKQSWSGLMFLIFFESALKKNQFYETALFSAYYLWDFNPGCYLSSPNPITRPPSK